MLQDRFPQSGESRINGEGCSLVEGKRLEDRNSPSVLSAADKRGANGTSRVARSMPRKKNKSILPGSNLSKRYQGFGII
jgi:hypothetical protein